MGFNQPFDTKYDDLIIQHDGVDKIHIFPWSGDFDKYRNRTFRSECLLCGHEFPPTTISNIKGFAKSKNCMQHNPECIIGTDLPNGKIHIDSFAGYGRQYEKDDHDHALYNAHCNECGKSFELYTLDTLRTIDKSKTCVGHTNGGCNVGLIISDISGTKDAVKITGVAGQNKYYKRLYNAVCLRCGTVLENKTFGELVSTAKSISCDYHNGNHTKWKYASLRIKYHSMLNRCYDPTNPQHAQYYDRGIKVCTEWLLYPEKFQDWSINEAGYNDFMEAKKFQIDRIDPNGDYCPENCRYISGRENIQRIDRINHLRVLTKDGEWTDNTLPEWSELFGYKSGYLFSYLSRYGLIAFLTKCESLISALGINVSVIEYYKGDHEIADREGRITKFHDGVIL